MRGFVVQPYTVRYELPLGLYWALYEITLPWRISDHERIGGSGTSHRQASLNSPIG